jgi:uncharacterized protein (TIGR00255 family)
MIRSMTGYGRAEIHHSTGRWSVELRSVNHRFCEISLRLPRFVQQLEGRARTCIQDKLMRGKITATVGFEGTVAQDATGLRVDLALLDRYHAILQEVRTRYGIAENPGLSTLVGLPDVLVWDGGGGDDDTYWEAVEQTLLAGCAEITRMKETEGKALMADLKARVDAIQTDLKEVEKRAPVRIEDARKRLQEKLSQILEGGTVDPARLAQEVAIYVDRLDCTEECVRLGAHCKHFDELLLATPSAGRKLNFLLQEMHREVNTIGSKANDPSIQQTVLRMKEELEKLREQIQNVE